MKSRIDNNLKKWSVNDIRSLWLNFFRQENYLILDPASLIPQNDNSLLWINSGVAALKKYFNDPSTAPSKNLANCQKVIRTNDIDRIDANSYHQTLFEMLGCFSIGGNFKKEVIPLIWRFFTDKDMLGIDPKMLFITVLETDLETYQIWKSQKGVLPNNIVIASKDTNFWDMGDGPCGPNTEIYYSFDHVDDSRKIMINDLDGKNFIEIINIVFSEFYHKGFQYLPLSKKCVDVGGGLERIALVLQGVDSTFKTDIWDKPIEWIKFCCKKNNTSLSSNDNWKIYVIADHLRTSAFAISDGALPEHKKHGYVIKKLLKRSSLLSYILGLEVNDVIELCRIILAANSDFYKNLKENSVHVEEVVKKEVNKFYQSFERSIEKVKKHLQESPNELEVSAKNVFFWYDTEGIPLDLIYHYLSDFGKSFNREDFDRLLEQQRTRSSFERESKDISTF